MCEIKPKLWLWTYPDLPRPVQKDKSLSIKQVFLSFLPKLYLSNSYWQIFNVVWSQKCVFVASPRKTMQNHLEISSKTQFLIQKVVPTSSWSGLGRSGHVQSQSFGLISHVWGPKMSFWRNFNMILHGFAWRSSKDTVLRPKTLRFDPKSKKHLTNPKRYIKMHMFK